MMHWRNSRKHREIRRHQATRENQVPEHRDKEKDELVRSKDETANISINKDIQDSPR